MHEFNEISEDHLSLIQGGTILGYALGWLTRAAFEAIKTDIKNHQSS